MKFGLSVFNFGPCATPDYFAEWARFAEESGFHALMISDHVAVTADVEARYPAPFYDPFVTLAWLAGMTSHIEIGTTVAILPYRHPLQVARMTANLDRLSHGRFIFGVGVGWAAKEFASLGIPFERRGAIANEYLHAIKTCWTEDVASLDGRYVSFKDVHTAPRPLRVPHPPIWVGGSSDAALRRAVRYGDAWHPIRIRVDWLRDMGLPRLRAIAAAEGRKVPALCPRIYLDIRESSMPEDKRVAGQGTIDQVRSDIEALAELGAQYVILDAYSGNPDDVRSLDRYWPMFRAIANSFPALPATEAPQNLPDSCT